MAEELDHDDEPSTEAEGGNTHTRSTRRFWRWYVRPKEAEDVTPASLVPVPLE